MNTTKYRVGTLTVRQAREVTEHYECAAWYKTVRCEPGEYPVYAYLHPGNVAEGYLGHTLYAPFEGEVTSASFVNRIGAHYGADNGPEMVGRRDKGCVRMGTSSLDSLVKAGDLELDPGLVEAFPYTSEDGERSYVFYRLAKGAEGFRDRLTAARA